MNRINNTNGRAASRAQLAHGLVNNEGKWLLPSGRGVRRKISRRVKPLASWANPRMQLSTLPLRFDVSLQS